MKKTLVIFPWIGEFGWELMEWNALCRSVSRDFKKTIVYCPKGKEGLYIDFADEIINVDVPGGFSRDRWFIFPKDNHNNRITSDALYSKRIKDSHPDASYFTPIYCQKRKAAFLSDRYTKYSEEFSFEGKKYTPEYFSFGYKYNGAPDVIFHIRNRNVVRPDDNWSVDNWMKIFREVKSRGFSIACIGSKEESLSLDGVSDFRGAPILKTCTLLKSCRVFLGPESGPTHLAALSEGNHIVWSRQEFNKKRCKDFWNPFRAKCSFIHNGNPSASSVLEEALKYLNK